MPQKFKGHGKNNETTLYYSLQQMKVLLYPWKLAKYLTSSDFTAELFDFIKR